MDAIEQRSIPLPNALAVEATFYRPAGEAKGTVLLVPAMGVAQRYYAPLAAWLAGQGYAAATFDFCGIGLSHNGGIRKLAVNILDWARNDCDAMLAAAAGLAPGRPLYWIGHSLGGQILGFVPGPERIARAVMVGAGSGYWAEAPAAVQRKAWWLWHVIAPVSTRLFGYFPGSRLGIVADLPRGVMEQWRRWCMDPDYAIGVEGPAARAAFAAVTTPITSLSFVDDELISARAVAALHHFYFNAANNKNLVYNLANALFDQGRYEEALTEYKSIGRSQTGLYELARKNIAVIVNMRRIRRMSVRRVR